MEENNIDLFEETNTLVKTDFRPENNESDDDENSMLINRIMEKGSCTKYAILHFICISFIFISYGMSMNLINVVVIPIKSKFNLSTIKLEFVSSVIFLGIALGACLGWLIADKIGRVIVIKISLALIVVAHLFMPIFCNLTCFIITRILIGFFYGIVIPICLNLIIEYHSLNARGTAFIPNWAFYAFGYILLSAIVFAVMRQLQEDKLKNLFFWILIFPVLACIINLIFLYDSPRNLILKKDNEESCRKGYEILGSINGKELTPEEKERVKNEVIHLSENEDTPSKPRGLFGQKSTILLLIICLIFACSTYGFYIITEFSLDKLIQKQQNPSNKDLVVNQILLGCGALLGDLIALVLAFIKGGRKIILIIFAIISAISFIPLPFKEKLFKILSPVNVGLVVIFGNFVNLYNVEEYPTNLVNKSTSFLFIIFHVGAFLNQYLYLGLFSLNYKVPYFVSFGLQLIAVILAFLLPYQSSEKPLKYTE